MKIMCPNCGQEMECMVPMFVSFPSEYYCKLTKAVLRKKEFKIWGVNWDGCDFICKKCGYLILIKDYDLSKYKEAINPEMLSDFIKKEGNKV